MQKVMPGRLHLSADIQLELAASTCTKCKQTTMERQSIMKTTTFGSSSVFIVRSR
jgi:predicted nucleic-acid-binding Zn-ribbon protein